LQGYIGDLGTSISKLPDGPLTLNTALKSLLSLFHPPRILVGFEIANNLYAPHLPKVFSRDAYGGTYPDLPSPLNNNFWNNEVKVPLKILVEKWQMMEGLAADILGRFYYSQMW